MHVLGQKQTKGIGDHGDALQKILDGSYIPKGKRNTGTRSENLKKKWEIKKYQTLGKQENVKNQCVPFNNYSEC